MITLKGVVTKIKMLDFPLVYFKLEDTNCLIAKHSLSFMADVEEGMRVVVCGEFNNRNQFVVKKYVVIGKTRIMLEIDSMRRFSKQKNGLGGGR